MPLTLIEFKVFRQSSKVPSVNPGNPLPILPIGDVVPAGYQWRVDHLAVAMWVPNDGRAYPPGGDIAPQILVFDEAAPGAQEVPCEMTLLEFVNWPEIYAAAPVNLWLDVDDAPGIVLEPGRQLAIAFANAEIDVVCAARAQMSVYQGTPGAPTPVAGWG